MTLKTSKMESTWFGQFKVTLWKNILLKRRNLKATIYEFLLPIYFVAILAIIRATSQLEPFAQFGPFPEYNLFGSNFIGASTNTTPNIFVAPDTTHTRNVMLEVEKILPNVTSVSGINVTYFANAAAVEAEYLSNTNVLAGIVFNFSNSELSYALRFPRGSVPKTDGGGKFSSQSNCRNMADGKQTNEEGLMYTYNCDVNKYLFSYFPQLQTVVDTALVRVKTAQQNILPSDILIQMLPKPAFLRDSSYLQIISSMYFVIAFSPLVNMLTVALVTEKEKKIKEGMKMMGLRSSVFWLAWGLLYAIIFMLITVVVLIIAVASKFFNDSNMFLFFMLMLLYGFSIISLSFLLTPFFKKAQAAGGFASMSTILASLLYLIVSLTRTYEEGTGSVSYSVPVYGRWLLSLLSPVALSLGMDQAIYLDIRGGMTFESATKGEFPLYAPMLMLLFDTILYFALAVYFDLVIPGEFGSIFKPYFLCTKQFWSGSKKQKDVYGFSNEIGVDLDNELTYGSTEATHNGDVEPMPASMNNKKAVRIHKLTKTFKSKDKEKKDKEIKAVNELSLTIYEDQITAILGHNGAGKTTLLNILTGLTGSTSGSASILGLDVSNPQDMAAIRHKTGVCPQHNILFDRLTCVEHLKLFAGIKGVPANEVQKEIDSALDSVGLKDQAEVQSEKLSGGQKRKLSVAIAIIGDPKIIFLDEPTAGMDPYSRRHLWGVLKEKKKGRVVLLTTHFMDEADILADRKAIVNKGSLRCCGSSLFLKNKYGLGYHLNMVIEPNCDTMKVSNLVSGIVPGSEINRVHGKELDITMPHTQVSQFSELFTTLEQESTTKSIGVKNYGVSMTTLEEVFLKLEEDEESVELDEVGINIGAKGEKNSLLINATRENAHVDMSGVANPSDEVICVEGRTLMLQRFRAFCKIRFLHTIRNPTSVFFQVFAPVILVIAGIILSKTLQKDFQGEKASQQVPLSLTPTMYTKTANNTGQEFPYSRIPRLLLWNNATGSSAASALKGNISSIYQADDLIYNNTFDLLDTSISPHYLGVTINQMDMATQGFNTAYKVLYNDSAVHSIPATINLMSNFLMKATEQSTDLTNDLITTYSLPWPETDSKPSYNSGAFTSVLIIAMAFVFIPSSFGVDIVKDRQLKVRSQLRTSGMPFLLYWGPYFTVDFIKFFIPAILAIIVVFAAQVESLSHAGAVVNFLILCILYIPANIFFAYFVSFMFDKYETCQALQPMIGIMLGYIPYIPVSITDMLTEGDTAMIIHYIMCIIDPPYVIFGGIYYIDKVYQTAAFRNRQDDIKFEDYFTFDSNIPICLIGCVIHIILFSFLLRVMDIVKTGGDVREACSISGRPNTVIPSKNSDIIGNEDEDVTAERTRVHQLQNAGSQLPVAIAEDLRKEFQKTKSKNCKKVPEEDQVKVAVRNATFAVGAGEVFGLLGPNGAGKTTLLNMMTADVGPDQGKVVVGGHDIRSSMSGAFQAMGYCPQHDALWDLITLQEHVDFYAMLRGIPADQIQEIGDFFIDNLKLQEHRNKRSKKLSGGTKRKLSYCMSMLGRPKIVLLDEPSTGMDPQSKRFLWDTISNSFENSERGAILTTHYMEEADALCSRIAIMVNGKVECIGSSQHLKNKYGSGYMLEVKLKMEEDEQRLTSKMENLHAYIKQLFPRATVMEQFSERVQYKVPRSDVSILSRAFIVLEEGKVTCDIAEYSFSQSTLEQVFLEFAKQQLEEGQTEKERETERTKSLIRATSVEGPDNQSVKM